MSHTPHQPEFSRPQPVADLDGAALVVAIEASAGERAALAGRYGLQPPHGTLDALRAKITLQRRGDDDVHLSATLEARLTQPCSVTLEPVADAISASFERLYCVAPVAADEAGGEGDSPPAADELEIDGPHTPEPPEPIVDGTLDLGEVVAEQLALEINPFPRKKGVTFEDVIEESEGDTPSNNPFQALAGLKPGGEPENKP